MAKSKRNQVNNSRFQVNRSNFVLALVCLFAVAAAIVWLIHRSHVRSVSAMPAVAVITFHGRTGPSSTKPLTFTVDVKDQQHADAMLADIEGLRQMPANPGNCPADDASSYKIVFIKQEVTVTAHPTGCQVVTISNGNISYQADARFWRDVHQATGKQIYPSSKAHYY